MTTPTQKQSETLKPCPFCGSECEIEEIEAGLFDMDEGVTFAAGCTNSECIVWQTNDRHSRRTEAAQAWNTRAQPSETPVVEKVREGIARYKAFSDFIFETLDVDPATTSITIQHPTKGEYPIHLKEVQDDLDEALALLDQQAAPDILTELKAAVEGMRKADNGCGSYDTGHDEALTAVADKIDEMIRRG